MAESGALSAESSFASLAPTESCANSASLSSTPPTSISDRMSLEPQAKTEIETVITLLEQPAVAAAAPAAVVESGDAQHDAFSEPVTASSPPAQPDSQDAPATETATTPSRPRRERASEPIYNLSVLAGSTNRVRRQPRRNSVAAGRRSTMSDAYAAETATSQVPEVKKEVMEAETTCAAGMLSEDLRDSETTTIVAKGEPLDQGSSDDLVADGINVLDLEWSVGGLDLPRTARSTRTQTATASSPNSSGVATKTGTAKTARTEPAHAACASTTRRSTRLSGAVCETMASTLATLTTKRSKKSFEQSHRGLRRELNSLADTNEFAKIEEKPVIYTIWRNGKFYDPSQETGDGQKQEGASRRSDSTCEPARKKARTETPQSESTSETNTAEAAPPVRKHPRVKKWLDKGLYAGQDAPLDPRVGLSTQEKKALAQVPELAQSATQNKALPFPIYNGIRLLIKGRDFKLPFDVCHPLKDQPKPTEWKKITKSRFVGDAQALWKKDTYYDRSRCVCTVEDGCGEDCLNRSVLYECNDHSCNVGREFCKNRAFQDLQERIRKGGVYRVGVEVFKTGNRGFGVRANRCFDSNQIIMEYSGEIITEEECDRRMNEVYKDKDCYYLMSFDQNMILDATTGSTARFVNHSCSPNCRMVKWIVSGVPRMALFAGDKPIMTGDELTYDYNFDPFSAKNVQKCLCGSANCRGVLGPKTRNDNQGKQNPNGNNSTGNDNGNDTSVTRSPKKRPSLAAAATTTKAALKMITATANAGKRKLKELLEGPDDDNRAQRNPKKRKIQPAVGVARSLSTKSTSLKVVAKSAVKTVTKTAAGKTVTRTASKVLRHRKSTTTVTSSKSSPRAPFSSIKKSVTRRASTSALLRKATQLSKAGKSSSSKTSPTSAASTTKTMGKSECATIVTSLGSPILSEEEGAEGEATSSAFKAGTGKRKSGTSMTSTVSASTTPRSTPRNRTLTAEALASVELPPSLEEILSSSPSKTRNTASKSKSTTPAKGSTSVQTPKRGRGRARNVSTQARDTARDSSIGAYSVPDSPTIPPRDESVRSRRM